LRRNAIPKIAVLVTGLTAAVLVATINPVPAQAFPNKQQECLNCHGPGIVGGTVNAAPSTTTPAAGTVYTVLVTEPANAAEPAGDTGYWIANSTAAGVTGTTTGVYAGADGTGAATRTATMTAPAAAGTYYYKVWAVKGSTATTGVTNFKVYSITVAGAPVVVTTTTALAMNPTAVTAVAPAAKTLTATVTGAGAAGTVQFFNGTTSLGTSPVAAGTASLALSAIPAGSYSYHAVFTPTDAALFTSSTSGNLAFTVTAAPVVTAPVASFTVVTTLLTAALTDTSTNAPTSWSWNLGNGTTSTVQSPSVTYAAAGTYTVVLTATNSAGSSTATKTITVTAPTGTSAAHISRISPDEASVGTKVTITGTDFGTAGVVKFGTVTATVLSYTNTSIVVSVPAVSREEVQVTVTPTGGTASNGVEFEVKGLSDWGHSLSLD